MSVDRWLCLLTDEEMALAKSKAGYGECWFHALTKHSPYFEFGDDRDQNESGDRLSNDCNKLWGQPAIAHILDLKSVYECCSDFSDSGWAKIEQAASDPTRNIYFYSE